MKHKLRFHQQGAETFEFAIIAVFYFCLLFGVFEFSRALYTWNLLTEATRRGARMAAVCPYDSPIPYNVTVFNSLNDTTSSSLVSGLSPTEDVTVRYLDSDGLKVTLTAEEIEAGGLTRIDFVEVKIDYTHQMIFTHLFGLFVPGWTGVIKSPTFLTTLPAESLGAIPSSTEALPTDCNF